MGHALCNELPGTGNRRTGLKRKAVGLSEENIDLECFRKHQLCLDGVLDFPECRRRIPMRILTRYILREVISHAAIGVGVFTFVLFTRDLGRLLDLVARNSAPLPSVAEVFFFTVPVALTI